MQFHVCVGVVEMWLGQVLDEKILLMASPGAASPSSSIAIRLTEHMGVFFGLGLHNSGNLVTWRGCFVDIVGS